jgi:hypothetical protein
MDVGLAQTDDLGSYGAKRAIQLLADWKPRPSYARADHDPHVMSERRQPSHDRHEEWDIAPTLKHCHQQTGPAHGVVLARP